MLFLAAQTFQAFAYWFWIPTSHDPQHNLLVYLLRVDRIRALLLMGTILLLIVPYALVALRYFRVAPVASVLGFAFGAAFVGFEISIRSIDFFVVGQHWAYHLSSADSAREVILRRFVLWNEMMYGLTFPLMLAGLLASCAFWIATSKEQSGWYRLGQVAFGLNTLRLLGRLISTYAGQGWLGSLNNSFYFPAVFVINGLLILWFFFLSRHAACSSTDDLLWAQRQAGDCFNAVQEKTIPGGSSAIRKAKLFSRSKD